jgi:hypothetical protein
MYSFTSLTYSSSITISYSNIENGESGIVIDEDDTVYWLEGNLEQDPEFQNSGNNPYDLSQNSPCIDTGIADTTGLFLPNWDLLHNQRIWDGDGNGTQIIDMGCYEYGAPLASGFIAGTVTNQEDEALENAEIAAGNYTTTTDENGEYQMEMIIGNYTVSCYLVGYEIPEEIEVTVNSGETSYADFILVPCVQSGETLLQFGIHFTNYPNPFNPTTTIEFSIKHESNIDLSIFNIKGQKIKTIANNDFTKGNHSIVWHGDDEFGEQVSSAVYYYKLNVNGKTAAVKKCLLLK